MCRLLLQKEHTGLTIFKEKASDLQNNLLLEPFYCLTTILKCDYYPYVERKYKSVNLLYALKVLIRSDNYKRPKLLLKAEGFLTFSTFTFGSDLKYMNKN